MHLSIASSLFTMEFPRTMPLRQARNAGQFIYMKLWQSSVFQKDIWNAVSIYLKTLGTFPDAARWSYIIPYLAVLFQSQKGLTDKEQTHVPPNPPMVVTHFLGDIIVSVFSSVFRVRGGFVGDLIQHQSWTILIFLRAVDCKGPFPWWKQNQ
jgi:hypothetical protein